MISHVPLHNHQHLLIESARLFCFGPVSQLLLDFDIKDILLESFALLRTACINHDGAALVSLLPLEYFLVCLLGLLFKLFLCLFE